MKMSSTLFSMGANSSVNFAIGKTGNETDHLLNCFYISICIVYQCRIFETKDCRVLAKIASKNLYLVISDDKTDERCYVSCLREHCNWSLTLIYDILESYLYMVKLGFTWVLNY